MGQDFLLVLLIRPVTLIPTSLNIHLRLDQKVVRTSRTKEAKTGKLQRKMSLQKSQIVC